MNKKARKTDVSGRTNAQELRLKITKRTVLSNNDPDSVLPAKKKGINKRMNKGEAAPTRKKNEGLN